MTTTPMFPPLNYDGIPCDVCIEDANQGTPIDLILKDHNTGHHGWPHELGYTETCPVCGYTGQTLYKPGS